MKSKPIIALDCDGVILDYNLAYARLWHHVFGQAPTLIRKGAYHATNEYQMNFESDLHKSQFFDAFDSKGWLDMPALEGAVEACQMLHDAGNELVVVSSMPEHRDLHRLINLQKLGIPVTKVIATGRKPGEVNPKLRFLKQLKPVAFADDLVSNFIGVEQVHCALIDWNVPDNPNVDADHSLVSSKHGSLLDFASYWVSLQR